MRVRVVDASAVAAILFDEPEAHAVEERVRDSRLVAPSLLPYELASVCSKKSRLRPVERDGLRSALARFNRLGVHLRSVSAPSLGALALETDLSVYDAAYLWLSLELGAPLVTLDGQLAEASSALGIAG